MVHGTPWFLKEERYAASTIHPSAPRIPNMSRLHFFSTQNQGLVADYLAHLRARHDAPTMQEGTLRALKTSRSSCPRRGRPLSMRT